jgi:hypothetical protein
MVDNTHFVGALTRRRFIVGGGFALVGASPVVHAWAQTGAEKIDQYDF